MKATDSLDIGVVIQAPMEDEQWLSKCALIGLITLIPIAGMLNMLGWVRAYADNRMRGEKLLPPANLDYMGAGWRLFLSFLPFVGIMFLITAVFMALSIIGAEARIPALSIVAMVVMLAYVPIALAQLVFQPAWFYFHIVHDDPWSSIHFGRHWRLLTKTGTEYLLFWVALLVANIVAQIGMFACFVGIIVSMPYAYAMYGAAVAEFARVTNRATGD